MSAVFPTVTIAEFPHGLRCAICDRVIGEGQPFFASVAGFIDEIPEAVLLCVYCPPTSIVEQKERTR